MSPHFLIDKKAFCVIRTLGWGCLVTEINSVNVLLKVCLMSVDAVDAVDALTVFLTVVANSESLLCFRQVILNSTKL